MPTTGRPVLGCMDSERSRLAGAARIRQPCCGIHHNAGLCPGHRLAAYSRPVNFVQSLRDRWHALIKELTKFGIIGVLNTALDFAVWNAVLFIGPIKAQVISTLVSATSSYFMNRHWTFRHRARSGLRREYRRGPFLLQSGRRGAHSDLGNDSNRR